jgi:DNA-3-methyladenine glycosylase II
MPTDKAEDKPMRRIECLEDIAAGLAELGRLDPRLQQVIATAGDIPLRRRPPGFEGLSRIVVSQQVSVASAEAIWNRLAERVAPFTPQQLAATEEPDLKAAGLSAPKIRTLRAVSAAVITGVIDLEQLADLPPADAHAAMTALHGIGPWTADIFLLFCAGHPDIWPAGDLALQNAVADAFSLAGRPTEKPCRSLAEVWAPWRSIAARLFWAYYKARREGREALPV